MELNSRQKQIIKESIKTRIACLNWSKSCMESSFKIGLGSLSDLHRCIRDIEESEQLMIDLDEPEVNNG